MELLDLLKWGNSQLLEISFGLLVLCSLPFLAYFLIKKWKFAIYPLCAYFLLCVGYKFYETESIKAVLRMKPNDFSSCFTKMLNDITFTLIDMFTDITYAAIG